MSTNIIFRQIYLDFNLDLFQEFYKPDNAYKKVKKIKTLILIYDWIKVINLMLILYNNNKWFKKQVDTNTLLIKLKKSFTTSPYKK